MAIEPAESTRQTTRSDDQDRRHHCMVMLNQADQVLSSECARTVRQAPGQGTTSERCLSYQPRPRRAGSRAAERARSA